MHRPPEASPRPPEDFAATLDTPEPVLLVGGQAVNLWALYYESRTKALAPFVSRDVDVLGDRETLTQIAQVIGCRPQFFPLKPPSNEVGVVFAHTSTGATMMVEVLRSVYGVTNEELRESVFEMALGAKPVRVLVPGPVSLLKAKIANAADLPQTGRQDARHVAILLELMPAFLADLAYSIPKGRIAVYLARDSVWLDTERKTLAALRDALQAATGQHQAHAAALATHRAQAPTKDSEDTVRALRSTRDAELTVAKERLVTAAAVITADDQRRTAASALIKEMETRRNKAAPWGRLDELIGSSDGAKFRAIVQRHALDILLGHANAQLDLISARYRLERLTQDGLCLLR